MPAPLPSALWARFQRYIAEGLSGRAAALRLKLSPATGARWARHIHETGRIAPAPQGRPKRSGKLAPHVRSLRRGSGKTLTSRSLNCATPSPVRAASRSEMSLEQQADLRQ